MPISSCRDPLPDRAPTGGAWTAIIQVPPDRVRHVSRRRSTPRRRRRSRGRHRDLAEVNELMPRTHGDTVVPCRAHHRHHPHGSSAARAASRGRGRGRGTHRRNRRRSSKTARRCRWGSARSRRSAARLARQNDLGVTPRCSPTGVILPSRPAWSPTREKTHPQRIVTSFVAGTQALRLRATTTRWSSFHRATAPTTPRRSQERPRVAINSALQVDLTGTGSAPTRSIGRIFRHRRADDFIRRGPLDGERQAGSRSRPPRRTAPCRASWSFGRGRGRRHHAGHVHWIVTGVRRRQPVRQDAARVARCAGSRSRTWTSAPSSRATWRHPALPGQRVLTPATLAAASGRGRNDASAAFAKQRATSSPEMPAHQQLHRAAGRIRVGCFRRC